MRTQSCVPFCCCILNIPPCCLNQVQVLQIYFHTSYIQTHIWASLPPYYCLIITGSMVRMQIFLLSTSVFSSRVTDFSVVSPAVVLNCILVISFLIASQVA